MNRLPVILRREFLARIRKPSFWVLTLLVPVVLAVLYALPVEAARHAGRPATVLVVDQTGLFDGGLAGNDQVCFRSMPTLDEAERLAGKERTDAILFIPLRQSTIPHDAFLYYRGQAPSPGLQSLVNNQLQMLLRNAVLEDVYHLEPSVYHTVESTHITLHTQDAASGHESFVRVKSRVAVVLAVLMVLALLLFGVQTMRSVQEERQNRTAEVLATSVRPTTLLVGKLLAVALAGMAQLVLWLTLTALCIRGVQAAHPQLFADARAQQEQRALATKGEAATALYTSPVQLVDETVQGLAAIRLPLVAALFLLQFLAAYLLYGALLAALAARLDSEADALQWTLLAASPLFIALALLHPLVEDPAGPLAVALSLVPFTAPVANMARLPFGLPSWQLWLGLALTLCLFAAAALWAARTYRRRLLR